jgi:hypothetical protein
LREGLGVLAAVAAVAADDEEGIQEKLGGRKGQGMPTGAACPTD